MHTRLCAGSPLKQDSFERAQALGLEGKTGGTDGTERAKRAERARHFFCPFIANKTERNGTERNGTETERFFDAYILYMYVYKASRLRKTVFAPLVGGWEDCREDIFIPADTTGGTPPPLLG